MNKKDAEKVIEDLKDKPFICLEFTIETDSGYVISLKPDQHIKTNADRIRSMSDEELAEFMSRCELGDIDYSVTFCSFCEEDGNKLGLDCNGCRLHWLQSEVEG